MKYDFREFYIGGEWAPPSCPNDYYVINPATEEVVGVISLGSTDDAARAVATAKAAFPEYSQTTPTERSALMARIFEAYKARYAEVAEAICAEIGAPITMSNEAQAAVGAGHIATMLDVLKRFPFEETLGTTRIELEPVGVCADHPMELADQPSRVQGAAGARRPAARWCSSPAKSRRLAQ